MENTIENFAPRGKLRLMGNDLRKRELLYIVLALLRTRPKCVFVQYSSKVPYDQEISVLLSFLLSPYNLAF